jgi:predicted ferric reductase
VWIATYTHRNLLLVYRNFIGGHRTRIFIEDIRNERDYLKVSVRLPRPWKVKPGQYVYLTTMRSGFFSIFQRHPFMVADSVRLEDKDPEYDFEMLIRPATGFTGRLLRTSVGGATQFSALIEGPYGHGFDLHNFGTVVLLASGMGIVGHLPYIQELVQYHSRSKTKTRDILLIWSVEKKTQRDLVSNFINSMLDKDAIPHDHDPSSSQYSKGYSKSSRTLGERSEPERPGQRPVPQGENASIIPLRVV